MTRFLAFPGSVARLSGSGKSAAQAGGHAAVPEAQSRKWINEWNKNPRPFVWTKSAEEILETLAAYCQRIIDSGHQGA
jgi:hypothetical protein